MKPLRYEITATSQDSCYLVTKTKPLSYEVTATSHDSCYLLTKTKPLNYEITATSRSVVYVKMASKSFIYTEQDNGLNSYYNNSPLLHEIMQYENYVLKLFMCFTQFIH